MTGPDVAAALAQGRALGLDRLDAHVLLGHVLGRPRTWLIAHGEAVLNAAEAAAWRTLAERRARGEPLAYLVGTKEFHGLALRVNPQVLIPRPETEILVDRAIEILRTAPLGDTRPRVVDLGTGSGAVALALKAAVPAAVVFASDASEPALEVAQANAARLGLDVEFRAGSWWQPWADERFDLVVSNPPYVAESDPHLAALRHEPVMALSAGVGGLADLHVIVRGAAGHLHRGGSLWLEHGFDQAPAVTQMLRAAGFAGLQTRAD
ncbi:MAG TPA: peptide chain release factor N(5)-glutamine methyltransferase, partial [Caldimonas sp.]